MRGVAGEGVAGEGVAGEGVAGEGVAGVRTGWWSGRAIGRRRLRACPPPHDPTASSWGVHSPAIPVASRAGFPTPYT